MFAHCSTRARVHRQAGATRARRGATLVIVAVMLTVFLGFAALALDVSRLSSFKAEVKTVADAAAMSAALDLVSGKTQAQAYTNVQTLLTKNTVEGSAAATVVSADVSGVTWNFATSASTTAASWSAANAVRVISTYSVNWSLARIFRQGSSKSIVDTSIAAFGARRNHPCMQPFVLPYSAVRTQLGLSPVTDTASLTAANVIALRNAASAVVFTRLDTVNTTNAASFGYVDVNQAGSGNAASMVASLTSGACVSGILGADSTLDAKPGFGDTTTVKNQRGILCGGSSSSTTCTVGTILVPIYDRGTNQSGSSTTTQTNQSAASQMDTLVVNSSCYSYSSSSTYSSSKCSTYVNTLKTASVALPVTIHGVSCNRGPTYKGRLRVRKSSGSKYDYYLFFEYADCYTITTVTVGGARGAKDYHVKYVGAFVWTAQSATTISGYFTTINYPPGVASTWDDMVGPITSVVLVK